MFVVGLTFYFECFRAVNRPAVQDTQHIMLLEPDVLILNIR